MAVNEKSFYASKGYRIFILIGAVLNFSFGLRWLYYIAGGFYLAISIFIIFFAIGFVCIFLFIKTRYVPLLQYGSGWLVIRYGARNKRPFTARSRVINIHIKKKMLNISKMVSYP